MYRDGRPGAAARGANLVDAWLYSRRWFRVERAATLEVVGRRSGTAVTLPVAIADHEGERYLVSMLGEDVNWVQNVRAAGGKAALLQGGRRLPVRLVEVPVADRPPVLRRYLAIAPGARPHVPVPRTAPLEDFERIAPRYPVFRIDDGAGDRGLRR